MSDASGVQRDQEIEALLLPDFTDDEAGRSHP